MIGSFGDIVFLCSDSTILTFQDLSFNRSASYAEHKILGGNGLVEFTGINAASCSISMNFEASLGVDPLKQITELERMLNDHEANLFVLDGKPVGSGYWVIESINETYELIDNNGRAKKITASVSLKEYYEAS